MNREQTLHINAIDWMVFLNAQVGGLKSFKGARNVSTVYPQHEMF